MTATMLLVALALLAATAAIVFVPRAAIGRAQDRLAKRILDGAGGETPALLTRAELVTGKWRRVSGVLGLSEGMLSFEGLFGEAWVLAMPRIAKIATGRKMASGRILFRNEILRITAAEGSDTEFVLTAASASAWRSHLGLWAMAERVRDAERTTSASAGTPEKVVPGR